MVQSSNSTNEYMDLTLSPDEMYLEELTEYCQKKGWPKFRAKQIYEWVHKKFACSADRMTNLPKEIREALRDELSVVEEETRLTSKMDGTIKFLYRMKDNQMIESVFMKYSYGNTICISSQAGCAMGCKFCASAIGGRIRNLTAAEMLGQVYRTMQITGERISNIVVMGTGESLDNYENLIRFLKLVTAENGYNLSMRNITVSSCGLVPEIKRLADEGVQLTFALSLHAVTDEERREIMPIANKYSIRETLDACRYYFDKTGRRVSFEYSLMEGVNDSEKQALKLAELIRDLHGHVNLIPINPVSERSYKTVTHEGAERFKKILEKNHINVTIRRGMGADIDAACGQLRRTYKI